MNIGSHRLFYPAMTNFGGNSLDSGGCLSQNPTHLKYVNNSKARNVNKYKYVKHKT